MTAKLDLWPLSQEHWHTQLWPVHLHTSTGYKPTRPQLHPGGAAQKKNIWATARPSLGVFQSKLMVVVLLYKYQELRSHLAFRPLRFLGVCVLISHKRPHCAFSLQLKLVSVFYWVCCRSCFDSFKLCPLSVLIHIGSKFSEWESTQAVKVWNWTRPWVTKKMHGISCSFELRQLCWA